MATNDAPQAGVTAGTRSTAPVLEIRVHGVRNTPPAELLGLAADEVTQCGGDGLGGFWTLTPEARAQYREPGGATTAPAHRRVPPGVRREAYSWGGLARLARVPGVRQKPGLVRGVVRALWVLIIPFGMVNVAQWTRDLDESERPKTEFRRTGSGGLVRLAGLALTLLLATTAVTVTLGILGAQCFVPATGGGSTVIACSLLPNVFDGMAGWTDGSRTALFAGLAVGALLALALVAFTGVVRYERVVSPKRQAEKRQGTVPPPVPADAVEAATSASWPWLARTGFWDHAWVSTVMWADHLAAGGGTLITILVGWWQLDLATGCPGLAKALLAECRDMPDGPGTPDVGKSWLLLVVLGWALLLVLVARVAWLRVEPGRTPLRVRWWTDAGCLAGAAALFIWLEVEVEVATSDRKVALGGPTAFAGLEVVPAVLIVTLVLLCLAAVGLRGHLPAVLWAPLVVAGIGAAIMMMAARDARDSDGERGWAAAAAAILVVLGIVAFVANQRAVGRTLQGWEGRGPAMFLALAAGFAMLLSGVVVAGIVAVLERSTVPEGTDLPVAAVVSAGPTMTVDRSLHLWTPEGYHEFAVLTLVVIAALVLAAGVLALRTFCWPTVIPDVPSGGPPPPDAAGSGRRAKIAKARRVATLAHRAERMVGWLAATFRLALVATLLVRPAGTSAAAGEVPSLMVLPGWLDRLGTWAILGAVGLLIASVVVAGSRTALVRPWGLLWDLMCFLPRTAHPFGPPCYAERAVPELRGRIDEWLGEVEPPCPATAVARPDEGRVVLSAHSLGAVISVAALLARWDTSTGGTGSERIALLTFGTQLRPYFGRFFPELLGPMVLGTQPSAGARIWAGDPWTGEPDGGTVPDFGPRTLAGSLTPAVDLVAGTRTRTRWRSLWRRTDYLGFPVNGYFVAAPAGATDVVAIDRMDAEWDDVDCPGKVATHGGDQRTPEYRAQLDHLLALVRPSGARVLLPVVIGVGTAVVVAVGGAFQVVRRRGTSRPL